jgi:hypothetical protein
MLVDGSVVLGLGRSVHPEQPLPAQEPDPDGERARSISWISAGVRVAARPPTMANPLMVDDLGVPALDQPGLVGVVEVVEVHAGLDRRPD